MRIILASLTAGCLVGASLAGSSFQQARPSAAPPTMSIDEVIKAIRADLQASRSVIVAQNVPLTAEQAARFWPLFDKYQKEQSVIMEDQLKGIRQYVEAFETMDDAGALALMKGHLERDARMVELRQRWLGEFQKVLPAKLAVRVMQIDRRLSLAYQMEIAAQIPLAE